MEKGVCNLIQKYSPEAVRERALSSPDATFQILVRQRQHLSLPLHRSLARHLPGQQRMAACTATAKLKHFYVGAWSDHDWRSGRLLFGSSLGSYQPASRYTWASPIQSCTTQVCTKLDHCMVLALSLQTAVLWASLQYTLLSKASPRRRHDSLCFSPKLSDCISQLSVCDSELSQDSLYSSCKEHTLYLVYLYKQ